MNRRAVLPNDKQAMPPYANMVEAEFKLHQFPAAMLHMTLNCIEFDSESVATPSEIVEFLRAVDHLVESHRVNTPTKIRGFVPSDYLAIYPCLKVVYDSHLLCGDRFCEWGSGVGLVASLAAMVGYESYGIEYDGNLCTVAEGIFEDFDVPVNLVNGSFIPDGVEDLVQDAYATHDGELALHTDPDRAYDEIGYAINDFDLIFAYPWPNDVELTHGIFDRCAARGAMLLAYYDADSIALYRKN
jgi:hypothetical protein